MATRILIPGGVLGLGFDPAALATGVSHRPDAICIDGGSTDSGPFYLGAGTGKYSRESTRSEWRQLMIARASLNVPLLLGSCGTCGTDNMVDWMFDLTNELCAELGQSLTVVRLYSEQTNDTLIDALNAGQLQPLDSAGNTPELTEASIRLCTHSVALAGAEPMIRALEMGADIVLAGRATDTAVIAALPLMRGEHAGAAWHGAKIGECGALCSTHPTSGVIQIDFDDTGFTVVPLAESARCTPHSVSAHMLYENADPIRLLEPGGVLDVSNACYHAIDEQSVRVTGSQWQAMTPYTVKLEGARAAGFQTLSLVLLREPRYVKHADAWVTRLSGFLTDEIQSRMQLTPADFTLEFRIIGQNAVLGALETRQGDPVEVGVMLLVTSDTQLRATEIARLANPFLLHYPLTDDESLPTFAFACSPAESERGAVYEFALNHVMPLEDPLQAFRYETTQLNTSHTGRVNAS